MEITTIGLDLAKTVFQVHAVNSASEVVVKKALRRSQLRRFFEQIDPCLVGIEACGTRATTHKIHHTIAATRQTEARKFLASLS